MKTRLTPKSLISALLIVSAASVQAQTTYTWDANGSTGTDLTWDIAGANEWDLDTVSPGSNFNGGALDDIVIIRNKRTGTAGSTVRVQTDAGTIQDLYLGGRDTSTGTLNFQVRNAGAGLSVTGLTTIGSIFGGGNRAANVNLQNNTAMTVVLNDVVSGSTSSSNQIIVQGSTTASFTLNGDIDTSALRTAAGLSPATDDFEIDFRLNRGVVTFGGGAGQTLNVEEFDVQDTGGNYGTQTFTIPDTVTINTLVGNNTSAIGRPTSGSAARTTNPTLVVLGEVNYGGDLLLGFPTGARAHTANGHLKVGNGTEGGIVNIARELRMGSTGNAANKITNANVTVDHADSVLTIANGLELASAGTATTSKSATFTIVDGTVNLTGAITDASADVTTPTTSTTINVTGGEMNLLDAAGGTRAVETLNFTGGTIDFLMYGGMPSLAATDVALAGSAGGSTIDLTSLTADGSFDDTVLATWNNGGGDMNWDTGTNWTSGVVPSGSAGPIATSDSFQVITSANAMSGDPAAAALSVAADVDWDLVQNATDITITRTGAAVTGGVARAVINTGVTVNRGSSLSLQPASGQSADATGLDISAGTLNLTGGSDLILGGTVATAAVNQSGSSAVNISGDLLFGGAGGTQGGTYNLDGGTLTVTGDIIEDSESVNAAQMAVDGGTLVVNGGDITVQRFGVGDKTGTTGVYSQTGGTLTTTGDIAVGENGTGTLTLTNVTVNVSGNMSNAEVAAASGIMTLDGTTTLTHTTTSNDFRVANNGTGILNMNGSSSLTQSGNFEVAETSSANGTVNMNTTGTLTLVTGNFILGQSTNATAALNLTNGTIDLTPSTDGDFKPNSGDATIVMTGGTVKVGDDWQLTSNAAGSSRWTISGGSILVDDVFDYRNNGDDQVELSGTAVVRTGQLAGQAGTFWISSSSTVGAGVGGNVLTIRGSTVTFEVGGTDGRLLADTDSTLNWEFDDTSVSPIIVGGTAQLNGAFTTFSWSGSVAPPSSGEHTLIDVAGTLPASVIGQFDSLTEGALVDVSGQLYQISYEGGDGNDVTLSAVSDPVVTITPLSGDVTEGTAMTFQLNAAPPVTSSIDVNLSYGGSADGSDYTEDLVVTFVSGSTQTVFLPTASDSEAEGAESVVVTLDSIVGDADIGGPSSATSFILDGATAPQTNGNEDQLVLYDGTTTPVDLADILVTADHTGSSRIVSTSTEPAFSYSGLTNDSLFGDGFSGDTSPDDHAFLISPDPATINPSGFSIDLIITPSAADLETDGVAHMIWETGGTTDGTNICLINGIPHLISSDGANREPSSQNDTDFGTPDFSICVPLSASPLVANERAQIAVIFTLDLGAGTGTVKYSVNGAAMATHGLTNTSAAGNWNGTPNLQIGNGGTGGLNANAAATAPFRSGDAVGLENSALESGGNAITSLRYWVESDGSMSVNAMAGSSPSMSATLSISGHVDDATTGTLTSAGGGSYSAGVWSFGPGTLADLNTALEQLVFTAGSAPPAPVAITVSISDGGTPSTGTIIVTEPSDPVYVDDDFSGAVGDPIADADGGPAVAPATFGIDAFDNLADAAAAVADGGTIIVNDGSYAVFDLGVAAPNATLQLTGSGGVAGTSTVMIASLETAATNSVDLGAEALVLGNNDTTNYIYCPIIGTGSLEKAGSDTLILRAANTYTGDTTISGGILRLGYDAGIIGVGADIVNNAELEINPRLDDTITIARRITGSGIVNTNDNGTAEFTYAGANTFSGNFVLGDGTASSDDGAGGGVAEGFVVVHHSGHLGGGVVEGRGSQLRAGSPGVNIANAFTLHTSSLRVGGGAGFFDFEISGTITPVSSERTIGHYGLEGRTITLSGGADFTDGGFNLQGTNGADNGAFIIGPGVTGPGQIDVVDSFDGGTITMLGANTYTGATDINAGTFILDAGSSHTGGTAYTVDGATLGGNGSTDAAVTVGATGTLAPGASVGTLTVGNLTMNGTLEIEVDDVVAAGTDYDQLVVNGTVNLGGDLLLIGASSLGSGTLDILVNDDGGDAITGTFIGLSEGAVDPAVEGWGNNITYLGGGGDTNDVVISLSGYTIFGEWRMVNFGAPGNFGAGANTANDDGDNLTNLLEFAFGTNPNVADSASLVIDGSVNGVPVVGDPGFTGGVSFEAFFMRLDDAAAAGLDYTVQFSADLVTFHDSPETPVLVADSQTDSAYQVMKVPYEVLVPEGKARYFRVKVTETP